MPAPADLRLPSIDGLRAFEASARLGSFERAADELAVTASAVGKRLATLEELLGTPLLLRQGKQLSLTVAGREYLSQVRAALALLAAVPLHRRATQQLERLRVTVPPTFARQILVPELDRFTRSHPDIELEVVLSIPFAELPGPGEPVDDRIEITHDLPASRPGEVLLHDRVLPVASAALIDARGRPRQPAELVDWPLLRTPIEPWLPWFRAAGLDWPEPSSGPKLVDLGLTLEAAVCGHGVALARPSLARSWLASGALQPLFALSVPTLPQYMLRPHASHGPAPRFAQWLRGVCAARQQAADDWLAGLR